MKIDWYKILACPVCRSGLEYVSRSPTKSFLRCPKCNLYYRIKEGGIYFLIPTKYIDKEKRILKQIASVYDRYSSLHDISYHNPMMRYMRRVEEEILNKYSRKGLILDLGCGTGRYTSFFLERNCEVVAADISYEMLLKTKERITKLNNVLLVQADAGWLPFKENIFDTIIAIFGALNHTPRYKFAIKRLYDSLKPGGILIFTVLNAYRIKWFLHEILRYHRIKWVVKQILIRNGYLKFPVKGRKKRVYTHSFSYFELRKLLQKVGFKKYKIGSSFFILRPMFVWSQRTWLSKPEKILAGLENKLRWIFPFSALGYYLIVIAEK